MIGTIPYDERLLTAVRAIAFAREIETIADVVRIAARELTGADGVTFVLRAGDQCHYLAENAIGPLWAGRRFPMDSCISGWVMRHAQPTVIPNIFADDRIPHDLYRATFVKSLAMVPVRRDDPVGAIGLYWQCDHEASEEELRIASTLADAAALALTNARLNEELAQAIAREREAREAAEAAAGAKDEWLSIVSHELRTPLTVILGRAQLLLREGQNGEHTTRSADAIARNASLLVRIVDDLLDASKIATGTLRIQPERVDLSALVADVLEQARPAAAVRAIGLTFEAPDGLNVPGDPNRLRQVLWNLVANAIKFSNDRSTVAVRAYAGDAEILIDVHDTGIGLAPSSLETIFDKFTQVDSSTTRAYGGLGLGLAITKRIVELHGGSIVASSAGLNAGATFTVRLPA